MTGALLRSGKISSFKALGKTGQPVYRAALQLRNAIERKNKLDALSLAIPQTDQQGDNIDWYSPVPGDVIPWSSATEAERTVARARLEEMKSRLIIMREELQATQNDNVQSSSKDKQVFEQLLEYVMHFPEPEFVYLVRVTADNAELKQDETDLAPFTIIPVITFWGFLQADAALSADPLYCLYPPKPVIPAVVPPIAAAAPLVASAVASAAPVSPTPEAVVPPVVAATPWWKNWRRWLWLLLPLLLLLLLLLFLRGCTPSVPAFWKPASLATSSPTVPSTTLSGSKLVNGSNIVVDNGGRDLVRLPTGGNGVVRGGGSDIDKNLLSGGGIDIGDLGTGIKPGDLGTSAPPAENNLAGPTDEAGNGEAEQTVPKPTAPIDGTEGVEPPTLPVPPAVSPIYTPPLIEDTTDLTKPSVPGPSTPPALNQDLALPPANADPAIPLDFLDGNWQAKSGIQDKRTGKPLRLSYQFNDGKGEATVLRTDGVICSGPVSAAMNNGNLAINSQGQAKCGDGGVYDMPDVNCKPDAQNMADCQGSYGDEFFPMTMRNAGE